MVNNKVKLKRQLYDALVDAFGTISDLNKFVELSLLERMDVVAAGEDLPDRIIRLIGWAVAKDKLEELIHQARKVRRKNKLLRHVAKQFREMTPSEIKDFISTTLSSNNHQGDEAREKIEDFFVFHKGTVGREAEIAKIDNFLRDNKSGYFVITGKAGFGKSALLAEWIHQRLDQTNKNYEQRKFVAYHFFNREFSATTNPKAGYTNLLRQLYDPQFYIHRKEDFPKEDFPVDIYGLRDKILKIVRDFQPLENEPLVIVIDALDEADDTIDPFTQHLPEGVFVIVSARADKNETPSYLKNWSNLINEDGSNSLFLEDLDKNSVKNLLGIGRLSKYQLDRDNEIVDLIYGKTGGFPLYLRYLIEEVTEALESDKTKESIRTLLEDTPKEFGKYIENQYDELLDGLPKNCQKEVQSLLSIMSVSLGAFSEQDVKKITSLESTELRVLPPKLRRWVRITEDEQDNKLFSFDHDLVRNTFAQKIFKKEKEDALKRLLERV